VGADKVVLVNSKGWDNTMSISLPLVQFNTSRASCANCQHSQFPGDAVSVCGPIPLVHPSELAPFCRCFKPINLDVDYPHDDEWPAPGSLPG
jgi:hypothetical protein